MPLIEASFTDHAVTLVSQAESQQINDEVQIAPIAGRECLAVYVVECLNQPAPV